MSIAAVNMPKYATVLNSGVCQLGTGASTVGATALGVDGIAADAKVCYTAGAYGGMVQTLIVSINDTAAVNMLIYAMDGAVVHPYGIVNIPINSGNGASIPAVDALINLAGLPKDAAGVKFLPLKPNMNLKVAVLAAMTANKILIAKAAGLDLIG